MCACQSCAIATRADGAGKARRDLPVRRVNIESSFKALFLNALPASPSAQSRLWTVGKFGLKPSLEAALKMQRGCGDSVGFSATSPSPYAAGPRSPPLLPPAGPPAPASSQGICCAPLGGLQLQGRRDSALPNEASCTEATC